MSLCTVTGKLLNLDGTVPTGATVSFSLKYPAGDVPRVPNTEDISPFLSPSVTVGNLDGSFSINILGNDQIKPTGTTYTVTFTVGKNTFSANYSITGSAFDLTEQSPIGGASAQSLVTLPSVTVSATPSAPGNFQVAHFLGRVPAGAVVMMTSPGEIWFQSPVLYDGTNLYLAASDGGVTAKIIAW